MSLPINTVGAVVGAARLAKNVASQVGQAIGFDEVLSGDRSSAANIGPAKANIEQLAERLTTAARTLLSEAGLSVNRPLNLSVTARGRVEIDSQNPLADKVEAILNSDREIADTARQIAEQGTSNEHGSVEITLD